MDRLIILSSVVGSYASGYATVRSDTDVRTIFASPLEDVVGLQPSSSYREYSIGHLDVKEFEIKKFLEMLLHSNPNSLEILFSTMILEQDSRFFTELQLIGTECITQMIRPAYLGIANTLIKRIESTDDEDLKTKLIILLHRTLLTCLHALVSGKIIIDLRILKDLNGHQIVMSRWKEDATEMISDIEEISTVLPEAVSDATKSRADKLLKNIRIGEDIEKVPYNTKKW